MHPMFQPNPILGLSTNILILTFSVFASIRKIHFTLPTLSARPSPTCASKPRSKTTTSYSLPSPILPLTRSSFSEPQHPILHCSGLNTHSPITTLVERSLLHLSLPHKDCLSPMLITGTQCLRNTEGPLGLQWTKMASVILIPSNQSETKFFKLSVFKSLNHHAIH